jgi:hypothetical protein
VIATEEEAVARLTVNGFTAEDVEDLLRQGRDDPEGFRLTLATYAAAGRGPDRTVWQSLADDLDPVSDLASKLIPVITLAMLL